MDSAGGQSRAAVGGDRRSCLGEVSPGARTGEWPRAREGISFAAPRAPRLARGPAAACLAGHKVLTGPGPPRCPRPPRLVSHTGPGRRVPHPRSSWRRRPHCPQPRWRRRLRSVSRGHRGAEAGSAMSVAGGQQAWIHRSKVLVVSLLYQPGRRYLKRRMRCVA